MKWKSYGLKAHKGGNPQIGEETNIAAGKVPKFVAGKVLKEAVEPAESIVLCIIVTEK